MAYIVQVKYGRFIIDGESYSSIFVTTGNTITFDVSHPSNADHPLKISRTKDGIHGVDENGNKGTELNDATAIVNNGDQIMFTPALDGIFYYYCETHANMGSSITSVQTKFTDLGATAYDAQDGDITNKITKKIYKKNENNVFELIASINGTHVNPWEVSNIDITEQASYKIEYNVLGNDNIAAFNQPLERYINIITAPPAPTRPGWLGANLPIDEEGRIWAIQTVHFNTYYGNIMPTIDPFTYSEPQELTASFEIAVNYVILRNDSLDGANSSDLAPYSFTNPSTGWDVGIPSTFMILCNLFIRQCLVVIERVSTKVWEHLLCPQVGNAMFIENQIIILMVTFLILVMGLGMKFHKLQFSTLLMRVEVLFRKKT